jgi:hypothetical protein
MPREANLLTENRETKSSRLSPLREAMAAILLCLAAAGPLWATDWLAERRQKVEQMTPAEKEELHAQYEKFLALSPDQQQQLRDLHQDLDTDLQGDRLRGLMHRYYDWLKTLTPVERADLLSMPMADRVAKIKSLKQHQEAWAAKLSGGSHLTISDVQVLSDWVKKYAAVHEAELKDMPPPRHNDASGNEKTPRERTRQFVAWRPWLGAELPRVSKEEIDDLTHQLSAEPRKAIEKRTTLPEKTEVIHGWLQAIWRQRAGGGFGGRHNVSSKELARFFQHDLSKEKQDELTRITDKDEQHRELRRLYFQHGRPNGSSTGAGSGINQHTNTTAPKTPETPPTQPPADNPSPSAPDAAVRTPKD